MRLKKSKIERKVPLQKKEKAKTQLLFRRIKKPPKISFGG
jgi:hypothetical protein